MKTKAKTKSLEGGRVREPGHDVFLALGSCLSLSLKRGGKKREAVALWSGEEEKEEHRRHDGIFLFCFVFFSSKQIYSRVARTLTRSK